jgi:hypothetical protein
MHDLRNGFPRVVDFSKRDFHDPFRGTILNFFEVHVFGKQVRGLNLFRDTARAEAFARQFNSASQFCVRAQTIYAMLEAKQLRAERLLHRAERLGFMLKKLKLIRQPKKLPGGSADVWEMS